MYVHHVNMKEISPDGQHLQQKYEKSLIKNKN
jgi:hypothetical protein